METTRLSTKGQVVLLKSVRTARDWTAGMEFSVEETPEGVLLRPVGSFPRTRLEDVAGCLKWSGKPKTIPEMNRAVAREARRRHDRGRH